MNSFLLDTNVLVRFFLGDNQTQKRQAIAWFRQAEQGDIKIFVPMVVLAETCFVIESVYGQTRPMIASHLKVFVSQHWLGVEDRSILPELLEHYKSGMHFVDSYLHAKASRQQTAILTFDKKLRNKSNAGIV